MPELVDPTALWQSLSPEAKDRIGALAIANELALQGSGADTMDLSVLEFHQHVANECFASISALVKAIPAAWDNHDGEPKRPDLNALGIRQCTSCGCTDDSGCLEGCSWADHTTCSACRAPSCL